MLLSKIYILNQFKLVQIYKIKFIPIGGNREWGLGGPKIEEYQVYMI